MLLFGLEAQIWEVLIRTHDYCTAVIYGVDSVKPHM